MRIIHKIQFRSSFKGQIKFERAFECYALCDN